LSGGANPSKANFALIESGNYAAGRFTTAVDDSGSIVLTFTPGGLAPTAVDFATVTSQPFPAGARGQCPYRSANEVSYTAMFSMSQPSLMRGIAGGLDADTYDWRVRQSGSKWGATAWGTLVTSLDYLRKCRDTGSEPLFTANMFGGGYTNGYGTWVCQFDNHTNLFNPGGYGTNAVTGTAAQLAADWVRYCNILIQTYRQGQESLIGSDPNFSAADNAENLRVYNSLKLGGDWGGRDVLLTSGEPAVPKVLWWEVGNEPEVDLAADSTLVNQHVIADKIVFRNRYGTIANAMKAVDSSIQTGPCLTVGNNNEWLGRVAEDTNAPLDFVGVHPYMSTLKYSYPNPTNMTTSLLDIGRFLADHVSGTALTLSNYGGATRFGTKPAGWYWNTPLIASEWNPVNWDATSAVKSSMGSGLGTVESCFRYAHPNRTVSALPSWFGANYWENPAGVVSLTNAFVALRDFAGDFILENPFPGPQPVPDFAPPGWPLRMYLTRQTNGANKLHAWGLNFSENQDQSVRFVLTNLPFTVGQVIRRSFGKPGAENSLTNGSGLGWTVQDVTGSVDPSNFTFTVENASFAILTFQETTATNWYWDTSMSVSLQGGSGTWGTNRLDGFWSTTPTGENSMLAWADGRGAVFDAALSAGGTITVTGTVSPRSLIVNRANCNFTGSGTITLGDQGMQINAPIQVSGSATNAMLAGVGGVLVNPGTGSTVTFNGTNTYTGQTVIASGTLALGSGGSISNTASIVLSNAASFIVSAKTAGFVLQSWQALGGSGSVTGRVTAYGTVSPGASVGTLTFNTNLTLAGTTVMEVSRQGAVATNDAIVCARTLTYGGTLIVTNCGPDALADGDTFRLFNAVTNLSAFSATNLSPLAEGFRWDTGGLGTGVVRVVYVGLGRPEFQSAALSGTNLILGGSNGIVGAPYCLLTSTNITLPIINWTPVLTNVFGPGGSFSNNLPMDPAEAAKFYRVQSAD
jgi:autotransporter-associated beta strand protein